MCDRREGSGGRQQNESQKEEEEEDKGVIVQVPCTIQSVYFFLISFMTSRAMISRMMMVMNGDRRCAAARTYETEESTAMPSLSSSRFKI